MLYGMALSAKDSRPPSSNETLGRDPLQTSSEASPGHSIQNLSPSELTATLKSVASRLGFTLTGVCPAVAPTGVSRLADWLDRGYAGQMHYIAARQEAYSHPRYVLEGCRSILMLGLPYVGRAVPAESNLESASGLISRYALLPRDYHDTIHDKLKQLIAHLRNLAPTAAARGVVDTAPLLEREFAVLAGLGWIGKHTLLIHREPPASADSNPKSKIQNPKSFSGSYFFLAALLTDLPLAHDEPFTADHCGTCRACLDACPTSAFPQPYVLDATRCISYLTIELRDHIPHDLRPGIGDWLFGCDICQDICPWNQRAEVQSSRFKVQRSDDHAAQNQTLNLEPGTLNSPIDLISLFDLDDESFRARFRRTPLWRPRRRGILRNAAIVLGNQRSVAAVPALTRGLNDPEPLIRAASAWALGQIATRQALHSLQERKKIEMDDPTREEIKLALREIPESAD